MRCVWVGHSRMPVIGGKGLRLRLIVGCAVGLVLCTVNGRRILNVRVIRLVRVCGLVYSYGASVSGISEM